jgi:hypothetical protein
MMPKGKPWSVEEENKLRQMLGEGASLESVAAHLGKSRDAVMQKALRLGLEVVGYSAITTTSLKLPKQLPSVEEALQILAGALRASAKSGLGKVEVQRLQVVATLAKTYKEILADYIDYRKIETKLLDLEEKYARLLAEKAKNTAS